MECPRKWDSHAGCLDSKWTYGIDIGRFLGIYGDHGDQGDQESKQIKQRACAQTARNKATKKTKKSNNKMYPSLAHLRIRCSTFLDASWGVVRLTRVDAALQSPSAKHLRFQCSHPWWQSPCRSGKGCRSHQSCTWGKDTKIGRKVSLHSWEGSCFDIVWKAAWFCLSNNRSFLSWVMLGEPITNFSAFCSEFAKKHHDRRGVALLHPQRYSEVTTPQGSHGLCV